MTLGPILPVSVVAALAGVGVYAFVRRVRQPMRVFTTAAILVLIPSFAAPLAMSDWTAAQAAVLNLMHVVVAGVTIWSVRRVPERRLA